VNPSILKFYLNNSRSALRMVEKRKKFQHCVQKTVRPRFPGFERSEPRYLFSFHFCENRVRCLERQPIVSILCFFNLFVTVLSYVPWMTIRGLVATFIVGLQEREATFSTVMGQVKSDKSASSPAIGLIAL
jgi:hypothetical protein